MKKTLMITAVVASSTAMASTEVTLWHAMGDQLGDTVNTLASNFNKSQKECSLKPVYKGSYEEALTAGIAAFRAKQSPNIIQIYEAGAATIMNAKGVAIPVTDLLNENGLKFNKSDYLSGIRNFYADSTGKMVGMPFNSSTPILYFNKKVLDKAGVKPPKTWEEFEKIAPKLKSAGYIALSQSHSPWIFSENFHSRHNLQLADKNNGFDGPATTVLYNNEHMKMHFSKAKSWKDSGFYGYYGENWGDNRKPFIKEEVAMWLGSSGSFGGVKQEATFEFGATYLPFWNSITNGKEYNSFIGGAALFAMSGKNKAENVCSAKFFDFLKSDDSQAYWHKETGYVPITNAAYEKVKAEGYYDKEPAAEVGVLQLKKPSGEWTKGYSLGYYPQIREVLRREYSKFFNGDITVDKMFETIEKDSNKLLKRFSKTVK